jgi:hypothetical protein
MQGRGFGLASMQERVRLANGPLRFNRCQWVAPPSTLAFLSVIIRYVQPGKAPRAGSLFTANRLEDLLIFLAVNAG